MGLEQQQTGKALADLGLPLHIQARLEALLDTYASLSADAKALQEQADIEKSKAGKILRDYGYDKVTTEEFSLCWVRGSTTSKLDPMKLLAQGVTNAMIEAATVVKPRKDYFQIRGKSASGDSPVDNG